MHKLVLARTAIANEGHLYAEESQYNGLEAMVSKQVNRVYLELRDLLSNVGFLLVIVTPTIAPE
eukprot:682475-Amorphochlora_amoeboformis.AAC.2